MPVAAGFEPFSARTWFVVHRRDGAIALRRVRLIFYGEIMRSITNGKKLAVLAAMSTFGALAGVSHAESILVQKVVGGTTTTLGTISAYEGGSTYTSAASFYNYSDKQFGGPVSLVDDRTHVFFVNTQDNGLSFFVVNGNGDNGRGGPTSLKTAVTSSRPLDFLVQDDPRDTYHIKDGNTKFTAKQTWHQDRTDGYALGGENPDEGLQVGDTLTFKMSKLFSKNKNHITSWAAYDADGNLIDLGGLDKHAKIKFTIVGDDDGGNGGPVNTIGGIDTPEFDSHIVSTPLPASSPAGLLILAGMTIVKRYRRRSA